MEMRVKNQTSDISPLVDEFLWTESLLDGGFSWSMRLKTPEWGEWWDLMLGRKRPEVMFRFKQQEAGVETSTEWKRAITDWSKGAFSPEPTMDLEIHGADQRLNMLQKVRTRTFKDALVADVVRRVGQDYGLQTSDVATTKGERTRWQLQEDDWSFLRRLLRGAASADGRGDMFLYMEEDNLRLVVVRSQDSSARSHDTASIENRLNGYVVQYHGRRIDRMGGATLEGVGYDFKAKAGISFMADSAAAAVYPALSKRVPRNQSDGLRIVPVIEDKLLLVDAAVRNVWGDLAPRYFSLRVNTRPDLTLKPNAVIEIVATDNPNRESVVQGRYALLEVQHRYLGGAISTTAVAYRREAWEGEDQPTGSSADTARSRDSYQSGKRAMPNTVIVAQVLR